MVHVTFVLGLVVYFKLLMLCFSVNRGLDPLVFCGICGVVSAGAGYAVGTQLFKTLWKVLNGNQARVLLEVCRRPNLYV